MITIEQRFAAVSRPAGFDYLRLVLASLVIVWHSFSVTGIGYGAVFDALGVFGELFFPMILGMFFALSGFLVAGSLERCQTLISFMGLRVIRIYPALAMEVLLSAFILGPTLTQSPLGEYFTSPLFFTYLYNILGHIHYKLPGLFLDNPVSGIVNSQLWTVPWELGCYLSLAGLVLIGARKWPVIFVAAMVFGAVCFNFIEHVPRGTRLLVAFFGGISIHYYRHKLPWNLSLFLGVLVIAFAGVLLEQRGLVTLCIPYITIYLGLCNPRRIFVIQGADYSYGMYLYGYVIQQALYQTLPFARDWYTNTILTLIVAAAFAAFSWICVERPALGLRKAVFRIEAACLRMLRRQAVTR
ncbi:peptidoglycan/LPS O-acetylase OafA/YrhL [Rhodobacter viridis]|uniref:Peptidoglycan/LPS O-acetylase OafA/YrhL n=1 Tax=Rhodobacter viridis TaxID=1054202 RepID=A0A318TV29_9RHOB|nr:acyltransferase [Rhodobacter viridis]PYF08676.1 peptidoglycan/LPS O-acetylase OafA/YrhL [Rhodobacter viridis]